MNERKYNSILYFIVITMLLTIAIQGYWNYNTYQENKRRYINDVQIALDNAIEIYYADLAEANQMTIIESDTLGFNTKNITINSDSIFSKLKEDYKTAIDSDITGFTQYIDSSHGFNFKSANKQLTQVKMFRGKAASDSIKLLKGIKSIFISIHNDTLDLKSLNTLLTKELERKKLSIDFALKHYKNDNVINTQNEAKITSDFLKTTAKTKFLKHNETLKLNYANATKIILKKGLLEILLSFILVLAIISCLFYLLKIIKNQKQLAEVKNDLISNITHEFKTPIATISVALESIKNFKVIDNKEKTRSYLDMSSDQLVKLNVMVEKLLETATLDSDSLDLNKEPINIVDLLYTIVEKHQMQTTNKTIHFIPLTKGLIAKVDVFHFENAINNILDNAIKYGGNNISVTVEQNSFAFTVTISDDGNTLTKAYQEKIFEKFYRIPKGNTHDIKGFGIGLYYTKKIIEKHDGAILLDLENKQTTFKISLPNG